MTPASLQQHLSHYAAICGSFIVAGGLLCASPDRETQRDGQALILATVFSGVLWSGVRITGENIRDAQRETLRL